MSSPQLSTDLEKLLVSTKFAPPRIGSRYVLREPLLETLARERQSRLILVTGSAGFGKTTLLAQWRQRLMAAGSQVAWLSLHPDERSFASFRTHVLAALGRLGMPVQDDLLLAEDDRDQIDETVAAIVNNVASMDGELHLMLDDYHHVEDPRAHQLVQKLLDHCPSNLHITLASRALPPLSVGRLRVMGQVAEIECNDLPFSRSETRVFLDQNAPGLKLETEEIGLIHDQTNGWPASLQLVAIMLKNRPESRANLRNMAWHSSDLQNYLWEDVIGHLPDDMATFMEALSICRRFNAALAEAIAEEAQATAFIERIEEENLLIMRADAGSRTPWYRFHPLFNEFLAGRLLRRGPERASELHRRASQWFAKRRLVVEAVRHATLAGDIDEAMAIIERAVPGSWKLSYLGPLLHLVDNVSLDAIAARPRILYLGSLTLAMTGATARAGAWLRHLDGCPVTDARARTFQKALVEATIAFQRDDIEQCLSELEPFRADEAESAFERYVYLMVRITALAVAGRNRDAVDLIENNPIPPDDVNDDMAMRVSGSRVVTLLVEGRICDAEALSTPHYARCVALHGRSSTSANLAAASLAIISYELNRIDDARELLASRQTHRQTSSPQMMIWATLCRARLDALQESADTALAFLERQGAYFRSLGLYRAAAHVDAEQVRMLLAAARAEQAETVARRLCDEAATPTASSLAAEIVLLRHIVQVRIALARGRIDEVSAQGAEARAAANALGRTQSAILASLLEAMAIERRDGLDAALDHLCPLVRQGAELGLVRTFADEGRPLHPMLEALRASGMCDDAMRDFLSEILGHQADRDAGASARSSDAGNDTPLTAREIEIVGLVAAGMSNKRIALTLQISVETVKWNLKNVFQKLGVSSRYDAMIWARRQGLID
jgi:LuxR family maltose regulon positive regulatory protein